MKMLFISTENVVEEVDLTEDQIREKIDGWMEIVRPKGLPMYCIIVDEDGIRKEKEFNEVGSYWYGYFRHGNPIVGDILVSKLDGAGNFVPLTVEDIAHLREQIEFAHRYIGEI
jgi:hypothetical protein